MAKKILFCKKCSEYTLNEICSACNEKTVLKRPPKYSPEDKMAKYRRIAKFEK